MARLPARGAIVASFEFLARLASRADLHSFHHVYLGHYMLSDKPYPVPGGIGALLSTFGDQYDVGAAARLRQLITGNDLHAVDAAGDLVLYLRSRSDTLDLLGPAAGSPPGSATVSSLGCCKSSAVSLVSSSPPTRAPCSAPPTSHSGAIAPGSRHYSWHRRHRLGLRC